MSRFHSVLRTALADEHWAMVVEATSAEKVLARLQNWHGLPALVIVDLGLPDLDGETFMQAVRQRFGPDLPLMVLSALPSDKVEEIARRVEAQSTITKPFELLHFLREVRRVAR